MGDLRRVMLASAALCGGCDTVWRLDTFGHPEIDASVDGPLTPPPNFAFVTSMKVVPGNLGGLAGADAICNTLGAKLGGNYVAWLSTSTEDARSRLEAKLARGWVRPDGKPFADTVNDIAHGKIWYPLRLTEANVDLVATGLDSDLVVATATDAQGLYIPGGGCIDFTKSIGNTITGAADAGVFEWTDAAQTTCTTPMRLYCLGTDNNVPVAVEPESDRLAFVTGNDLPPTGGRAAMDLACQNEAAAFSTASFHAALPTSLDTAISRFTLGTPWVRFDHVTVISATGARVAAIDYDGFGQPAVTVAAWAGASALDVKPANATQTCGDWTAYSAAAVRVGDTSRSSDLGFGATIVNCSIAYRAYCLQD